VTAGGLVIREPSPCLSPLGPPVSPQAGAVAIRPVTDNGEQATQQPPFLPVVAAITWLSPKWPQDAQRQAQVTVETVTDEEVGLSQQAPTPIHHTYACMERASPESEQRDSILGNPIAWSMAQDAFQGNIQSHFVSSITLSINKLRSSHNTQTIKWVMCECTE
jgi:beta-glucanase (GH16 family)